MANQMEQQMSNPKRAVLLVNLGSPDSPSVADVRKYLRQFLMDERVIDAPYLIRKMIVELFILPFRPQHSAHAYQTIWWKEGSPLIAISKKIQTMLQNRVDVHVELAMRYGNPSIEVGITTILNLLKGIEEILLVPLYPHYAMATFETVVREVDRILKKTANGVKLTVQPPFYNQGEYINALVASAGKFMEQEFDYLLFSYHGVPKRHCKKTDPTGSHCFKVKNCCNIPSPAHQTCYRHQCFETTKAFVKLAGVPQVKYSLSFQSRLGRDSWLTPFTDQEVARLAKSGIKKLLVICPAFVSDCLETLEEIGIRAKDDFLAAGGKEFTLIPCLNDHPVWIDVLGSWCGQGVPK